MLVPGVDVAGHALAGGDGLGEGVLERVAALRLADGGVGADAVAGVAVGGDLRGVGGVAIVGIEDVAGGAAAGAVVARMVVGAGEREQRRL